MHHWKVLPRIKTFGELLMSPDGSIVIGNDFVGAVVPVVAPSNTAADCRSCAFIAYCERDLIGTCPVFGSFNGNVVAKHTNRVLLSSDRRAVVTDTGRVFKLSAYNTSASRCAQCDLSGRASLCRMLPCATGIWKSCDIHDNCLYRCKPGHSPAPNALVLDPSYNNPKPEYVSKMAGMTRWMGERSIYLFESNFYDIIIHDNCLFRCKHGMPTSTVLEYDAGIVAVTDNRTFWYDVATGDLYFTKDHMTALEAKAKALTDGLNWVTTSLVPKYEDTTRKYCFDGSVLYDHANKKLLAVPEKLLLEHQQVWKKLEQTRA